MWVWLLLIVPSFCVGLVCGWISRTPISAIVSAALPWFGLLGALIYTVYFTPHDGGGATMWMVAQVVGGTVAAACGFAGFVLIKQIKWVNK
ncbi:hypothetical protein QWI17_08275 [Gilvimarinus sp. SDUM040013]|uniref:Uncharacterized protein n=1 Tax=Gilvimarinus gilvus TaxID=3058038 RepID=A0ABU4S4N8_9GAMM|nr:hypothetical protein [Gilvimarinus sp. SDUM040013]MDO3385830.1 hypothetical protein [Gilvimarinus sp. SDUM040013]MDX6851381.1 hypothetical protein [Gilvimarinus sp. SDUM040013]